jgi:hypothetical protein
MGHFLSLFITSFAQSAQVLAWLQGLNIIFFGNSKQMTQSISSISLGTVKNQKKVIV